jgi:hypothetical protein
MHDDDDDLQLHQATKTRVQMAAPDPQIITFSRVID